MEQDTNAPGPQIYLFMYFKLEETTRWAAIFYPSLTNRQKMPEMLKAECTLYEIHCEQQHLKPGKEITAGEEVRWGQKGRTGEQKLWAAAENAKVLRQPDCFLR